MPEFEPSLEPPIVGQGEFDPLEFLPDGNLSDHTISTVQTFDPPTFGFAVTTLVDRIATLPEDSWWNAGASIEGLVVDAQVNNRPIDLDISGLLGLYRDAAADPARTDIAGLVVHLLLNVDRDAIFDAIQKDAAGMNLWSQLTGALDEASGVVVTTAVPEDRNVRGIEFPDIALGRIEVQMGEPPPMAGDIEGTRAAAEEDADFDDADTPDTPDAADGADGADGGGTPTYRAYGLLDCKELVLVEETFPLRFGLSETQAAGVAGPPIEVPRPETKYDLQVQLFADGFDLGAGESWHQVLKVSRDELFPTEVVHLTARNLPDKMADRTITATFSIGGETLGVAVRQVRVTKDEAAVVVPAGAPARASGTNITAPTGEPKAHVTITIAKGLGDGVLQWGIVSDIPGVRLPADEPTKTDIGKEPKTFALEIIKELLQLGGDPGLFQLLGGIGDTVHDEVPTAVQEALSIAAAAVAPDRLQVLILTEEPFIPWELAALDTPFDPDAPNFLGAQANVGRWILDPEHPTDPPRAKTVSSMAVVWGVYTNTLNRLLAAEQEAALLQKQYKAKSVLAEPQPVTTLLDGTPAVDVLHFAVHGKYDPQAAGDGIYLVKGAPLSPLRIRGAKLKGRAPFVFLNACQVGSANTLLGNYGGMAQAFLKAGASAVVAPLWSIDDQIAQDIALEFYRQALVGAGRAPGAAAPAAEPPPVAEILRQARVKLFKNAADKSATYLAYQFYGHPTMRLSWK